LKKAEGLVKKFHLSFKSFTSMAQSLIKKLDKVEHQGIDEDDNSVMNTSFSCFKEPGEVVTENVTKELR
jgi:hypothetical protein